ncbi:MAG: helix-turn-helix transcriptional regulator, partial [Lachnospiraceae bacterium]|nr:helix-turn-helix transcriptional regulator [Lachnospiraceae bacterium]
MIKDLPEKLRELRTKHKYSQRALAQKIGVSPASIAAYESGDRTPSAENILAFAHIYHCSTDYLLGNRNAIVSESVLIDTAGLTD